MSKVKLIGAILLVVAGVIVILQNNATVPARLLFLRTDLPLSILLLLATLLGFALGILASLLSASRGHKPPK